MLTGGDDRQMMRTAVLFHWHRGWVGITVN